MFFKRRARASRLKTLHLHIGWPKCGSSSLQWILGKNQALLEKAGYYYPVIPGKSIGFGNGKPLLRGDAGNHPKRTGGRFFQRHPDIVNISDRPEFFKQNYLNTDAENLVISAEGLYRGARKWDLSYVYDHFEFIKIYWVIRPKLLRVQSGYLHGVRSGKYKLELAEAIDEDAYRRKFDDNLSYAEVLKFWSATAGRDNINIILMSDRHPGIVEQFFQAMMGDVPKGLKVGKNRLVRTGAVATAAIMTQPVKAGNLAAAMERIKFIRQRADELKVTDETINVLTPEVHSRLSARYLADDEYFVHNQQKYSIEDIRPDLSDIVASSTTLASVREWDDYLRLRKSLAEDGIKI
jgi:hypothetical protein